MRKIAIVTFVVSFLMLMLVSPGFTDGNVSDLYKYEIKGNGTIAITDFDWKVHGSKDVYVPQILDGYTVTEIGEGAFSDLNASFDAPCGYPVVVVLPDTVTVINDKAFFCSNITGINISENVRKIGSGAFAGCINLSKFSVDPENSTYATIDEVLYDKKQRMLIAWPLSKKLDSNYLVVPNGIKQIDDYAFYSDGIVLAELRVQLPDTIEQIGSYAFYGFSGLISADVSISNYGIVDNSIIYKLPASLKQIKEYAFAHTTFSKGVFINAQLECIEDHAFEESYLGNVSFEQGSNINCIGAYAFKNSTITTGDNALVLPSSIIELGEGSFQGIVPTYSTDEFKYIDLQTTELQSLPDYCFSDVYFGKLLLPNGITKIGAYALKASLGAIAIPSSVEIIGANAFSSGGGNIFFTEDSNLKILDEGAFAYYHFNGQHIFSLPEGLKEIHKNAFEGCKDIETLVIPESVELIENDICDRSIVNLQVVEGSYADIWVYENGYTNKMTVDADRSWLSEG